MNNNQNLQNTNLNIRFMVNNFAIKYLFINHNYKPNGKNYDECGLGVYLIQGQLYAVVQRTYF